MVWLGAHYYVLLILREKLSVLGDIEKMVHIFRGGGGGFKQKVIF
jgi:hypothetical protein